MRISRTLTTVAVASLFALPLQAFATTTAFSYTGSPHSYVGGAQSFIDTTSTFSFTANTNYDNGVSLSLNGINGNSQWWYFDFAAAGKAPLTVGTYLNATRFPFQTGNSPGLSFSGNGRGDNTLTGQFTVLEATYSPTGTVQSFAANFVQYDEGFTDRVNVGAIRYNSTFSVSAVPEPSTWAFMVGGLALLSLATARKRRSN